MTKSTLVYRKENGPGLPLLKKSESESPGVYAVVTN